MYKEPKEKPVKLRSETHGRPYKPGQGFAGPYDSGVTIYGDGQEKDPTTRQYRNLSSLVDRPTNPYTFDNVSDPTDDRSTRKLPRR